MPEIIIKNTDKNNFYEKADVLDRKGVIPLLCCGATGYSFIVNGNDVVGFIRSSEDMTRISGFVIHQDYREKGLGKKTIDILKINAREKNKSLVVAATPSAYEFYEKCGLTITDHEPGEVWLKDLSLENIYS